MSENVDPLGKMTEGQGLLGKIRNFLSGFIGYFERDQRREADKMLREAVANRYQEQWERISALQRQLIAEGDLEHVDNLEAAALKIRTFVDRVEGASYGYAGFFDHVQIGGEELAKIYEYDSALLESVERVGHAIDNVETSIGSEGLPAALRNLESISQEVIDVYNRRDEVILSS